MKIVYASGGSGGPVSPLLAIHEELREQYPEGQELWIGSKKGAEAAMVSEYGIPFKAITTGKLRRYFSVHTFADPFKIILGFIQSFFILRKFRPDILLTAGSFIAVPVYWAARLLRVPVVVHQQDIEVGLANKLMDQGASLITVSYKKSLDDFKDKNVVYTSNPVRKRFLNCSAERGRAYTGLTQELPTILVMGGGQGATAINQLLLESIGDIIQEAQVIHITGAGKGIAGEFKDYYSSETRRLLDQRYRAYEFIHQEMCDVMASADIIICRAGISTLTEASVLHKAMIIIPIPQSHQVANAEYYAKHNAAKYVSQEGLDAEGFKRAVLGLLGNEGDLRQYERNSGKMIDPRASRAYIRLIKEVIDKK